MIENNINILDLMQSSPNAAITGQLGLLESIESIDGLNLEQPETSFDMIFGNMLASLSPELNSQNEVSLQTALTQENQTLLQPNDIGVVVEELVVDKNILAFNKELEALPSKNFSIKNINIKEILANQDVELENGQFKVISKEVVDSQLSLTIEGSNGKQLTVSLPIDAIQNQNSNTTQQRISLEGAYYNKQLELLVDKVNIEKIEIKLPETTLTKSDLKPVEISFVGEQNASTVTLKATLKKNEIKITKLQTTTSHQKAAVLDESGLFDEKVVLNQNQSNKLIEKISFDSKQQLVNLNSTDKQQVMLKNAASGQSIERTDSIVYSYNSETIDTLELKENIQNVRMQLPENIKSVLRPNGQAVVIKMNPENLGPAKLSLTFSGGKLRAKLIVTSVNAKQILDSSMTRLVDQLQKIDINVGKIDVTLDENQSQNEQFNQKQQWQRKMSHNNIDLEQIEQNEIEKTVQKPMVSAIQQVSSSTVNYLA